ncbi:MAG: TetR/AcrR family transcriptional regulator [Clostridia bacterium]|nr:TetR/AcrR family transcriptional regulator [Clostridia bacterium]
MPKLIPELKQKIIAAARHRALADEGCELTIRQVAADCGVSVGAVYNYFPSKEALLTAVMMEDWQACCQAMESGAADRQQPLDALRASEEALRGFTSRYAPTWTHYRATQTAPMDALMQRHRMIIDSIAQAVIPTLKRFDRLFDPALPEIVAELLLMASREPEGFNKVSPILAKLLS